jgi:hypothetical protein
MADVGDAESGSGGHYETQRGEVGKLFEKRILKNTINICRPA